MPKVEEYAKSLNVWLGREQQTFKPSIAVDPRRIFAVTVLDGCGEAAVESTEDEEAMSNVVRRSPASCDLCLL